jgi:uncharacterized protein YndB with AHSA1/START domain
VTEPSKTEVVPTRAITITRVFDAPLELVWKVWTEPEHIMQWWGPKDYTAPFSRIDLRVGGTYLSCMRSAEGRDIWSTGVFRDVVPMKRIVCTDSFADAEGNLVPATHYGFGEDFPLEMLVTVTFEEFKGKTMLTLHHAGFPEGDFGELAGWNESLDKFAATLAQLASR